MATIIVEGKHKDRRRIQFIAPDKSRGCVSLGKATAAEAKEICEHVEHLVECWKFDRRVESRTVRFVSELLGNPARVWLYDRMATAGLVTEREQPEAEPELEPEVAKLDEFLDAYIKTRTDLKEGTLYNLELSRQRLVEYFGEFRPLGDIAPGDADDYKRWLHTKAGDNTARRFCGRAKQFFRAAVRKRLIAESPFADMKNCNVQANRDRDYFVTRDEIGKAIDAAPDAEWRLIIALARYGGVRTPSETLLVGWTDIDWEHSRMTVHSPKTEHHTGRSRELSRSSRNCVPTWKPLSMRPSREQCTALLATAAVGLTFGLSLSES